MFEKKKTRVLSPTPTTPIFFQISRSKKKETPDSLTDFRVERKKRKGEIYDEREDSE